jgi:AcrR family transcriptional regulator
MPESKKKSRGEVTRDQFLSLAVSSISEHGVSGISISGLSTASGMTRPTFYSHFGDMDGLIAELWLERAEEWILLMTAADENFDYRAELVTSLTEVFLHCHRNVHLKEIVAPVLQRTLEKRFPGPAEYSVALWRMANRIGVVATARVWPAVAAAMVLDEYLEGLHTSVIHLDLSTEGPLPEIEIPEVPGLSPKIVEAVLTIVQSSGVEGLSMLRLGRVLRVTTGYLYPRIHNLAGVVGSCYQVVQDAAVKQNLALWSKLRLSPEGFARFIVGSVGSTRLHWRNFRSEVLIAAAHNPVLAASVTISMESFHHSITRRTAALLFPRELVSQVALLVHTLLFGFTALHNAGIEVRGLAHAGVIRALLGRVAKRYVGFGKASTQV